MCLRHYLPKIVASAPCAVLLLIVFSSPLLAANSELTPRTVQILGRMISFVSGGPTGTVLIGIVYDGGKAGSKDEAESLMTLVGQGIPVGNIQLKSVLVPVGSLEAADKLDAIFVTSGLSSFDPVYDYTRKRHLVSLTLDDACVAQAKCVMTVKAEPKVEITVSRSAAEQSGVVFGNAFRIMIREVP